MTDYTTIEYFNCFYKELYYTGDRTFKMTLKNDQVMIVSF